MEYAAIDDAEDEDKYRHADRYPERTDNRSTILLPNVIPAERGPQPPLPEGSEEVLIDSDPERRYWAWRARLGEAVEHLECRISNCQYPVIGLERTQCALMLGVRQEAEDDLPAVLLEKPMESLMDVDPVRSDVHAADLTLQEIEIWREDDDLRLLDVRLDIVNEVERAQHVTQRDSAHQLDLGHEILARHEILGEARGVVDEEVA